jgi:hypothetical protein
MDKREWLAERFEAHRTRMRAAAERMLGERSEADDAVQEAWPHLSSSDTSGVENLRLPDDACRADMPRYAALAQLAARGAAPHPPARADRQPRGSPRSYDWHS